MGPPQPSSVAIEAGDPLRRTWLIDMLLGSPFALQTSLAPAPDLVVLALSSTERHELSAVRELHRGLPDARIVVVTTPSRDHDARLLVAAGADGLVLSADAPDVLEPTVHAVLAGQVCVQRELRGHAEHAAFSHREKQVLYLMAEGATNRQIGASLFLTESTVKSHLASAFAKLGVRSRAEAAVALQTEGARL